MNELPAAHEVFDALAELALNVRSSWNHATDEIWREIDPRLWEITRNPWAVLRTVSRDHLDRQMADPVFRANVQRLLELRRERLTAPAWFQRVHPQSPLTCAAYF